LAQQEDMPRVGNRGFSESPGASTFQCSDGWISIAANTPKQFQALCKTLNVQQLLRDSQLIDQRTMTGKHGFVKAVNKENVQSILTEACLHFTARHLESELNSQGVPAASVRSLLTFISEALNEGLVSLPSEKVTYANGTATNFMNGFISNEDSASMHSYAPGLGQHTESLLLQLGLDSNLIANLKEDGAVYF